MDYHPASWGKKKTNEMYRPELASPLQYQQVCSCLTPGADVGFGGKVQAENVLRDKPSTMSHHRVPAPH